MSTTDRIIWHRGVPVEYPVPHDPDSTLWYVLIWDYALADLSATIQSGSWIITPASSDPPKAGEMTATDSQIDVEWTVDGQTYQHATAVLLSGGTVGEKYTITCQITTSVGEVVEKSFRLRVNQN